MAYKLLKHRKRGNTRHMVVVVNPDAPEADQIEETFDWGMDVPLNVVRRETLALLDAKYKQAAEVTLPGEAANL